MKKPDNSTKKKPHNPKGIGLYFSSDKAYEAIYGEELTKENTDPKTWEELGGDAKPIKDEDLPF